jgi:DNA polymerase-1
MVEAYKKGMDAHSSTARLMLGLPDEHELTDDERQVGKTGNFSIVYSGGKPTIIRQLTRAGIPCDEARAKELLAALNARMPGVKQLKKMIIDTYHERGWVETVAGRRLTPDPKIAAKKGKDRAESALLNYVIQGSAAEIMRHALRHIHKGLLEGDFTSHLVNVVHDEAAIDCLEDEVDKVVELVPHWMDYPLVSAVVPIETDLELSDTSWADKHAIGG